MTKWRNFLEIGRGTGIIRDSFRGPLAQLVEHLTFNQVVERSNRSRPTIFFL